MNDEIIEILKDIRENQKRAIQNQEAEILENKQKIEEFIDHSEKSLELQKKLDTSLKRIILIFSLSLIVFGATLIASEFM
ncbi:hypothetical protein [Halomonas sp. KM-1]|uniref:hypothetical protein n=1 Tax=Halomonas sp. KM-1 TaxID=590061 RepID=UPI0011462BEB|nr:hypothetical protein [Halomonas sp. KM-1]